MRRSYVLIIILSEPNRVSDRASLVRHRSRLYNGGEARNNLSTKRKTEGQAPYDITEPLSRKMENGKTRQKRIELKYRYKGLSPPVHEFREEARHFIAKIEVLHGFSKLVVMHGFSKPSHWKCI